MIAIDTALTERLVSRGPIQVGLIGAGFSGRNIAHQVVTSTPGIRLAAICNRTLEKARTAYKASGVQDIVTVDAPSALDHAVASGRYAVTSDPSVVYCAQAIEAIVESTGTVDFAAEVVLGAIKHRKHVILVNVELDATLGPYLKTLADVAKIVYTNTGGDEPGAAMDMIRFVRTIGVEPVVAGNLKGLYDPYRNPATQKVFAERANQDPARIASFADGTKLSLELCVLANGSRFTVAKRGMYGPELSDVNESAAYFRDKVRSPDGIVDFLVGAAPGSGIFVLGYTDDPYKAEYLKCFKMGDGPLYPFYRPFHLPQFEVVVTIARAVLFHDATVTPAGPPICDAVTIAKRDLSAGEVLDGFGGFTSYSLLDRYSAARASGALPIGLSTGRRLTREVRKDDLVTFDDVEPSEDSVSERLRGAQDRYFGALTGREG